MAELTGTRHAIITEGYLRLLHAEPVDSRILTGALSGELEIGPFLRQLGARAHDP